MKRPLTVKEFAKNNRILIGVLVVVFVVSLAVFISVFWNELYDVGAWGSLVAGIFTYLGSSFLGIVVFYNTQSQQRQKEIEDQINVEVNCFSGFDPDSGYYVPFTVKDIDKGVCMHYSCRLGAMPKGVSQEITDDQLGFLFFSVRNLNTHVPLYIKPISIHTFSEEKKLIDLEGFTLYTDTLEGNPIDYKQLKNCYIGINKTVVDVEYYKKHPYLFCYVLIKLQDTNNQVVYAILHYSFGKSFSTGEPIYLTEQEYTRRIKESGSAVFPSIKGISIDYIMGNTCFDEAHTGGQQIR